MKSTVIKKVLLATFVLMSLCSPLLATPQIRRCAQVNENPKKDIEVSFKLLEKDSIVQIDTFHYKSSIYFQFTSGINGSYVLSVPNDVVWVGGDPDWQVIQFSNGKTLTVVFDAQLSMKNK